METRKERPTRPFGMTDPRWQRRDSLILVFVGLAELVVFFRHPGHFFAGDTLFWMGSRYRSVAEFLSGFYHLDPFDWYRPLSQRTVESLLFPLAGMNPTPYHLAIFVLFFMCTISVFVLAITLTQNRVSAWIATLFFAFHITHAITTSDTSMATEMIFFLFSVGSAVAYIRYLRTHNVRMLILSSASCIGALLSKETAVVLPFALFAIWLLFPQERRSSLRSLIPHFAILAAYLIFTIGILHTRGIQVQQLVTTPGTVQGGYYELTLGRNIIETSGQAFSWAFSVPRGMFGNWQPVASPRLARVMIFSLKAIRILICAGAFLVLFTPQRKFVLIGIAWFLLLAGPTLSIVNHFLPYYLFTPLVGFAIALGVIVNWIYERLSQSSPRLALAACTALILVPAVIDANMSGDVAENYFLAGGSQKSARNQLTDVQTLHPALPRGMKLLFFDEENTGTSWNHAKGKLFQMPYDDESIKAEYVTDGFPISVSSEQIRNGEALAFKLINGRLVEYTSFLKQRPDLLLPHSLEEIYEAKLSKAEIHAGEEFLLRIPQLKSVSANILRAFNGVVEEPFTVNLDSSGETKIKVPSNMQPGTYTYVAVQRAGGLNWCTVHASIRVLN